MRALLDAIETRLLLRPGWLRAPSTPSAKASMTLFERTII
jgi:hypothetical protein